jgi:hypothetical protein
VVQVTADLDAPGTPQPMPHHRVWLPWTLFATATIALLALLLPRPVQPPQVDPTIGIQTSDGPNGTVWVHRRPDGSITVVTVVRPFADEETWCQVAINGTLVAEDHGDGGTPAVCVAFWP